MTENRELEIPDWLRTMPKVELHVHLEGTISASTLWELSQEHEVDLGVHGPEEVRSLFRYDDFTAFIDTFTMCSDCLRTAADLGRAVSAYGEEMARQNIRYAELHFNPEPHFRRRGITFRDGLDAMNRARESVLKDHGIEMRWIADGVRDAANGPVSALHTVNWMREVGPGATSGIVALGLGGNEINSPPKDFVEPFRLAMESGFHVVAHAGEATGPEAVWDTLHELQVERIGHGVASAQDDNLLAYLAERSIPLEISPTSNLRTGVIADIHSLPLRQFHEAGVPFSINTDDPPMFGTDLIREYALAMQVLNLDRLGVARMVASAIDQSFADEGTQKRLHQELRMHTPEACSDAQETSGAMASRSLR